MIDRSITLKLRAALKDTPMEYFDQCPAPPSGQGDASHMTLELLRNRALLHLLRCTGGRVSEVLSLKRMQVQDRQLDEVQIVGKGGKARTLFLPPHPISHQTVLH